MIEISSITRSVIEIEISSITQSVCYCNPNFLNNSVSYCDRNFIHDTVSLLRWRQEKETYLSIYYNHHMLYLNKCWLVYSLFFWRCNMMDFFSYLHQLKSCNKKDISTNFIEPIKKNETLQMIWKNCKKSLVTILLHRVAIELHRISPLLFSLSISLFLSLFLLQTKSMIVSVCRFQRIGSFSLACSASNRPKKMCDSFSTLTAV